VELKSLHGRKVAIDASMAIYQFLIAVRSNQSGQQSFQLTNDAGETTSHIQGMFNRTIRYMTEGIRPVYVFDGKPPQLKSHELHKRRERREKAELALKQAAADENIAELDKQSKRLVRAGQKENVDCQTLLRLMGVPVIIAPCEAEAQAASLAQEGLVYGVGTEDMDALTFRTPVLIRKMTFAGSGSNTAAMVQTINYEKAILGLDLSHDQFVDLCILLGCDYCDTIRGVGPKTALKLIREYKSIEGILQNIDKAKYTIPDSWIPPPSSVKIVDDDDERDEESPPAPDEPADDDCDEAEQQFVPAYVQARKLFMDHEVLRKDTLSDVIKWKPCQVPELTSFLVDTMGFNADRVASSIAKLQTAFSKNSKPQSRLDSFFRLVQPTVSSSNKRKVAPDNKATNNKKFKGKPSNTAGRKR
jgi:flap endonuclease-1